jgi:thioredoxin-related protein
MLNILTNKSKFTEQDLVKEFEVKNLPTLIFYKNGVITDKLVGTISAMKIYESLEK